MRGVRETRRKRLPQLSGEGQRGHDTSGDMTFGADLRRT